MDQAIEGFRSRFEELTAGRRRPARAAVAVIDDCFRLSERDIQRNRVLVAEQGLLSARSDSPREEQARQAARARTRDLEFAWASFLSHAMQQGAIPKNDPRLLTRAILGLYNSIWHWYRPNGIVALNRVAEFFTDRSLALIVAPRPGAPPHELLRALLRRARRPGSALVARARGRRRRVLDPVGARHGSRQPAARRRAAELRAFIDAGDMSGWAHHVLFAGGGGDVEFALGETRYDGERIGTFLAVAQLDGDGRMARYMVARSPAIAFEPARVDAG